MEKEYSVRLNWEVSQDVTISANSPEEAEVKAKQLPLPHDGEYVPDSFSVEVHNE